MFDSFCFFPNLPAYRRHVPSSLGVFTAVKGPMTMATLLRKTLGWQADSFRGSVPYHHDGEHHGSGIQADVVLQL